MEFWFSCRCLATFSPVIQSIRPEKDVDGLHIVNAGKLATGDLASGLISCTPAGAMLLLRDRLGADLSGLNAVVIGRSNLFGAYGAIGFSPPMQPSRWLIHARRICLPSAVDILVAAVGRAQMVRKDWAKPGATVIDVGINRIDAPEKGRAAPVLSVMRPLMNVPMLYPPSPLFQEALAR